MRINPVSGFPLLYKNELLGVIAFDADMVRDFSDKEFILFKKISNMVAMAIYNAQLFSRLEQISITDGLTELYNHRHFQDCLTEEIQRTERKCGSMGLLIIDVDNFKLYNDSFGHPTGDELLRKISRLIQENVRGFDIVSRYGGEEFTVILVDCGKDEAAKIAERIRAAVEQYYFYGREKQPNGAVTISIGVAIYPEIKSKANLIQYADRALYRAKKLGRNRVEVHHKAARKKAEQI